MCIAIKFWDELSAPVWNGFMSKEHQYCECNHTVKKKYKKHAVNSMR